MLRPVAPGSSPTVALVSPASPVFDSAAAHAGIAALQAAGMRVVRADNAGRERGYLAGTPEERAADLHWAFGNPEVDVVMALRGGYGSAQVIPLLDFDWIAAHPKPFVGMSDITSLHLALGRFAGLVTLWGPTCTQIGRKGGEYALGRFARALSGEIAPMAASETLRPGRAQGLLAGGTTTLLAASLGTPYELETEGRVLLLEDVDVDPYEVDRCLTQLLHAGKLESAAGFAVAEHTEVHTDDAFDGGRTLELAEVFEDILVPLGRPAVYGLPLGHGRRMASVPLGVNVELDADSRTLQALEPWQQEAATPVA